MPKPKKTKKVEEEQVEEVVEMSEEELQQELTALLEQAMGQQQEESDLRVAQLYGEVEEKMAADLISAFLILRESGNPTLRRSRGENGSRLDLCFPYLA
jgi:hypothetical protein